MDKCNGARGLDAVGFAGIRTRALIASEYRATELGPVSPVLQANLALVEGLLPGSNDDASCTMCRYPIKRLVSPVLVLVNTHVTHATMSL